MFFNSGKYFQGWGDGVVPASNKPDDQVQVPRTHIKAKLSSTSPQHPGVLTRKQKAETGQSPGTCGPASLAYAETEGSKAVIDTRGLPSDLCEYIILTHSSGHAHIYTSTYTLHTLPRQNFKLEAILGYDVQACLSYRTSPCVTGKNKIICTQLSLLIFFFLEKYLSLRFGSVFSVCLTISPVAELQGVEGQRSTLSSLLRSHREGGG